MSPDEHYDRLFDATRAAYCGHADLMDFAPFPDDVRRQAITPYPLPCADVLREETGLFSQDYQELRDAIVAAGPFARWRDIYRNTSIGDHFLDRFGCYSIIGEGGPFSSEKMRLWMVYMPADLYYPWHHHPGEEIYLVIAGNAVFKRQGLADETLYEGMTLFHASNQPHAMQTQTDPVLCLVAWRDNFAVKPVLTNIS